jgi:DNA polymerase-4
MNSYFASVEQQANPFLRGKAVGVCAYLSPRGVIIASSMEAKAKGIKTGCTVGEAQKIDPQVVLVENEPAKYRSTTEKIFAILKSYSNDLEPYSIDEAFLDITGWVKDFDEAENLSRAIQERIKNEVGEWLNCSVGISWTKFLAKFAGDLAPKKGILVIGDQGELAKILKDRPLIDAWGIGERMKERLNVLGIYNLWQLKNFSPEKLKKVFGLYGYYLWANVNGIEISAVNSGEATPKSVGHSYALPKKTADKEYLLKVFAKLCEKTGRRLRALGMEARGIHVGMSYVREGGWGKSRKLPEKIFTTEEIFAQTENLINKIPMIFPVRLVAISVTDLSLLSSQASLFENNLGLKQLSLAMDKLNDKYGEYTVVRGVMYDAEDIARDRIGFRKIT